MQDTFWFTMCSPFISSITDTPNAWDFGLDREFLDMPIPEAEVRMIAPIREAVQEWEPRATVKDVFFTKSGDGSGRLLAHVEIEINELGNG